MSAKGRSKNSAKVASIVVRKEEVVEGGHHGGAWKVAYADFVTAMMAFFLLMWLINATTEAQRKGLADYFSPQNQLSRHSSGTGKPFGGSTPFDKGALVSSLGAVQVMVGNHPTSAAAIQGQHGTPGKSPANGAGVSHQAGRGNPGPGGVAGQRAQAAAATMMPAAVGGTAAHGQHPNNSALAAAAAQETRRLGQAASALRAAVGGDPALRGIAGQIGIDLTKQGLRIQILDNTHRPMFANGAAEPNPWTREVLRLIAPILARLSERISIAGYTDAAPYPGKGLNNWALSSARAEATRAVLVGAGLPASRVWRVLGYADRDLLLPAQPLAAANRRIAIVVRRAVPVPAPAAAAKPAPGGGSKPAASASPPPAPPPAAPAQAQSAPGDFVAVPGAGTGAP